MVQQLSDILDDRLRIVKGKAFSLAARLQVINHIIVAALWYILNLWTGNAEELRALEKKIVHDLWVGDMETARHRVKLNIVELPKDRGGIGLISLIQQVRALASKLILWAITDEDHPLKKLMQASFREMSLKRWGIPNFAWVLLSCMTTPANTSKLFTNLCATWNKENPLIKERQPTSGVYPSST